MGTMLSRRSFVRLGMATGGALLLAACGQAPSPTPTSPQPPTIPATSTTPTAPAAKPTPAPTGKIEITFSTWGGGERLKIWRERVVGAFEQKHPTITVNFIGQPTDYQAKLLTMIAGGTPPDVFRIEGENAKDMYHKKFTLELDSYMRRDNFNPKEEIIPPYEGAMWQGKWMALPHGGGGNNLVFYNKNLFRQAGLPDPKPDWTWEEFLQIAKSLTKDTNNDGKPEQWGTEVASLFRWYYSWLWNNGGDELDTEGKTCVLDQPPATEAIQWIADLRVKHKVAPAPQDIPQGLGDIFLTGRIGMLFTGNWYEATVRQAKFEWGVTNQPKGPVTQMTFAKPNVAAISANTKYPDASWLLLRYLVSEENQRVEGETGLNFPQHPKVLKDEKFLKPTDVPVDRTFYVPDLRIKTRGITFAPGYAKVLSIRLQELDPVMLGTKKASEVTKDLAQKINKILAEALQS